MFYLFPQGFRREESGKEHLPVTFCGHDAHGKTSGRTHRAAELSGGDCPANLNRGELKLDG
jgi:hypothetical protein